MIPGSGSPPDPGILLPGRDFHLPAQIGQWSPKQLNDYLRIALQNDPSIMPSRLKLNGLSVQNITYQGNDLVTVINNNTTSSGAPDTPVAASGWAQLASARIAGGAATPADLPFRYATFDPVVKDVVTTAPTMVGENEVYACAFGITSTFTCNYITQWLPIPYSPFGMTVAYCGYALFGPWSYSNRAAVPRIGQSSDISSAGKVSVSLVTSGSRDLTNFSYGVDIGSPILSPGVYYAAFLLSKTGAPLTTGQVVNTTINNHSTYNISSASGMNVSQGSHGDPDTGVLPPPVVRIAVAYPGAMPSTLDTTTAIFANRGSDTVLPFYILG